MLPERRDVGRTRTRFQTLCFLSQPPARADVHDHDRYPRARTAPPLPPTTQPPVARRSCRSGPAAAGHAGPAVASDRLRLTEIFHSIQGEADAVGWRTVFIRLTGCPLRCTWCDTPYSFHGGQWWTLPQVLQEVARHQVRHVCVTGGEPLAQKRCLGLLASLCDAGYEVSLETSGALDIGAVDRRVRKVVDFKAPGSGEVARNLWTNIDHLLPHDQVKFVLCGREDYDWAVAPARAWAGRTLPCCCRPSMTSCRRHSLRNGCWRTGCRHACNCSCTSCCGATSRAAEMGFLLATVCVVVRPGWRAPPAGFAPARGSRSCCRLMPVATGGEP